MKRTVQFFVFFLLSVAAYSQTLNNKENKNSLSEFRQSIHGEFDKFRNEILEEYINFVRDPWKEFESAPPIAAPKDTLAPVVMPDKDKNKPLKTKPLKIDTVVPPVKVLSKSKPITRIEEVVQFEEKVVNFSFFGTSAKVRFDLDNKVVLAAVDENSVANALEKMAADEFNNTILDCVDIKKQLNLSDWAYLQLVDSLAHKVFPDDSNSASLLMAYLYMSSGYKMRLASYENHLYMLYASEHIIYEQNSYVIDGFRYYGIEELPSRLRICRASFESELPLSLLISGGQEFAYKPTDVRHITSEKYPEFSIDVVVNKNLLDFYSTYPTSMVGDNMLTRWAMYANTPFDDSVSREIYPFMKEKIAGLSELEAAEYILNFVQTGFEYEYDDTVWGEDRVFFPDECLYYEYNDCDDRSVLFSRLIRDLLGLDVALVVVPGHILAAVNFTEEVNGGFAELDGRKFTLCEPTCTNGAPVGWSDLDDNATLSFILLDNDRDSDNLSNNKESKQAEDEWDELFTD